MRSALIGLALGCMAAVVVFQMAQAVAEWREAMPLQARAAALRAEPVPVSGIASIAIAGAR